MINQARANIGQPSSGLLGPENLSIEWHEQLSRYHDGEQRSERSL